MSFFHCFQLSVEPSTLGIKAGLSGPHSQLYLDLDVKCNEPENIGVIRLGDSHSLGGIAWPRLCNSPQSESVGVAGDNPESPCDAPGSSKTPATSNWKGSFNWDQENGWAMEWPNFGEFEAWLKEEQLDKSIEFILSSTKPGKWLWSKRRTYVCSHQMSEGHKEYEKKHPDGECKFDSKKTSCCCQIKIKHYPHTQVILGCYTKEHDHEIQLANIAYTCLSQAAHNRIKVMLQQKVNQKEIVCNEFLFLVVSLTHF